MQISSVDEWKKYHSKPCEVQLRETGYGCLIGDDLDYGNAFSFLPAFGSLDKMMAFTKIAVDCMNFAGNPYTSQEDLDAIPGRIEAYVKEFGDEENRSELDLKYMECKWLTNIRRRKNAEENTSQEGK